MTLSDKELNYGPFFANGGKIKIDNIYTTEDVKQFIKDLKDRMHSDDDWNIIKELAGGKLL